MVLFNTLVDKNSEMGQFLLRCAQTKKSLEEVNPVLSAGYIVWVMVIVRGYKHQILDMQLVSYSGAPFGRVTSRCNREPLIAKASI